MAVLELLSSEHRVILAVLDVLQARAARSDRGDAGCGRNDTDADAERAWFADAAAFLRGYADALHHGKEEQILFAALPRRGVPPELGPPLAGIVRDHETARLLTADLAALAARRGWSAADRARLHRTVADYGSLLRRPIAHEDRELFPAVATALGAEGLRAVERRCEQFERAHASERDGLTRLAERLVAAPVA